MAFRERERRSQSYQPQFRPCSTPRQRSARTRSRAHVLLARRQVLDPKARRERARLLAAHARLGVAAQRRAEGDIPHRPRDDDECAEARVDGDVEGRVAVAVGDERERDEEGGAEAHPAAQERRVRLIERVVQEPDRSEAQHGRSHPWFCEGETRWCRTCERATHRYQSNTDALGNFFCLDHLAQCGCYKNNGPTQREVKPCPRG